jgi:hypothetical protein
MACTIRIAETAKIARPATLGVIPGYAARSCRASWAAARDI